MPVLKIVEVDCVEDGPGVCNPNGGKNSRASFIIVEIANHSFIVSIDGIDIE